MILKKLHIQLHLATTHSLRHLTAATAEQGTRLYLPYLIHIDGASTVTPPAYFLKTSPSKGFAHVLQGQGMMRIVA